MLCLLRAATPALYLLCITMAQVAGQEEREKTPALKGELTIELKLWITVNERYKIRTYTILKLGVTNNDCLCPWNGFT